MDPVTILISLDERTVMNMQFLKRLEVLVSMKSFTCEAQVPLRAGSKRPTCTGGSFLLSTQVLPGAAEDVVYRQTLDEVRSFMR